MKSFVQCYFRNASLIVYYGHSEYILLASNMKPQFLEWHPASSAELNNPIAPERRNAMRTNQNTAMKSPESETTYQCPYCQALTPLEPAVDYAPVYNYCAACGRRFIVERVRDGFSVMRLEEAPCGSDPECRIGEMSQGDEE